MKKEIFILFVVFLCFSFSSDVQKRIVRDGEFDIECYISTKKIIYLNNKKLYYWYKSGEIHFSQSNVGGSVLHNEYLKYYRSNQLAEKGVFNYGLKTDVWKSWHENGQLKEREIWNNGFLNGEYTSYNSDGDLVLKGRYRNNFKVGYWINYKTKDTSYYKKDFKFDEKPKNLVQRLLRKKDSTEKVQIKFDKINKKRVDSIQKEKLKRGRLIKKRNDSIRKAQEKINRLNQKTLDSIEKTKKVDKGFFNKLFKRGRLNKKEVVKKSKEENVKKN
ncbi:hypothetical protein QLS71_008015 [Mariniflexile litorale]|uniref:MORN repeat protein n=1 Tax=Mariniflexile litorale TaxID=3045158 RepID=A0AAU7ELM4_9FLAO|nr:hypothetical protein [Mariniflexile sp. KMM 9835]MDQ8213278.1 hypothetical protein [Mariniflexile sp. KMM 9835]